MHLHAPRGLCAALLLGLLSVVLPNSSRAETRLLRQPSLSDSHIVFSYGSDLWIVARDGGRARRLTSTPAVESNPHFSPDGKQIAFSSNRSGVHALYVLPVEGGTPERLSWYPAASFARGWTADGKEILYATSRGSAPSSYERLWTVSAEGGPSEMLPAPWGHDGSYSSDGKQIVVDRVTRWDSEWRHYRGGQNTPLTILDLSDLSEIRLPNKRSTDTHPLWMNSKIYFLSDRNWNMNIWVYDPSSELTKQLTDFDDVDVKWLSGRDGILVFERGGWIHTLDTVSSEIRRLEIDVIGDFPWAETRWEEVGDRIRTAALSPTGKRAVFEARGEIFTVPVEKGDPRNLSRSSGAADRSPVWSPDGGRVAWFSDPGDGYELLIAGQDGLSEPVRIDIGDSKMAWEATWSPDGRSIAFVDDDVRVRVLDVEANSIKTVDSGGTNIERGSMGLIWSHDSKWLAYAKTFPNNFHRIVVWPVESDETHAITDRMADAVSPAWDRDGKHLYFLASTNLALASGWANTSVMQADPTYSVYAIVLGAEDPTPFDLESDEEEVEEAKEEEEEEASENDAEEEDDQEEIDVQIDFEGIERRILALPMPNASYAITVAGPKGTVFIGERNPDGPGMTLHKFSMEDRESKVFASAVSSVSASKDGKKLLYQSGDSWHVVDTDAPPDDKGNIDVSLRMRLDRTAEWRQMFDEAWHYERDFFYDPDMHGRDWIEVRERYAPLIPYVKHRADLSYIFDQLNGELSVGHSFVGGGDFPSVDESTVGLLGADLAIHRGAWRIERIYTFESWNPSMSAPLDQPGLKVEEGDYIVAVSGVELAANDDPYRLLDGTAGRQTVLHISDQPSMDDSWTIIVEPIASESALRQRTWVEDNRRRVDELSDGKLAYVWVPNTGGPGFVSFNRYFFAQQDKLGAVIDERYNGGGLLDDYMVDLMTRSLRAAITNEVPDGKPFVLPAGILGPKVLLINERAGSGGDYFPWVFRQQKAGPLIGTRTWGGLVKSSVHYPMIDGGSLTAPDNAVFDPIHEKWIAENEGVPPDIEVFMDARSVGEGRDPQLERGVEEVLRLLEERGMQEIEPPPFSSPAGKH